MECLTCKSISGEQPISPAPRIFEGQYWLVDHAYPCKLTGWLVLVLKQHAEALHKLSSEEFTEMGDLLGRAVKALKNVVGSEKEYVMCFAEAEGFQHIHVHIVPKASDLPEELRGPGVFAMLKVSPEDAVPPDELRAFCDTLRNAF
jgi:diadenosine tetraphosphate (Ap4A) HIT family hydrolase